MKWPFSQGSGVQSCPTARGCSLSLCVSSGDPVPGRGRECGTELVPGTQLCSLLAKLGMYRTGDLSPNPSVPTRLPGHGQCRLAWGRDTTELNICILDHLLSPKTHPCPERMLLLSQRPTPVPKGCCSYPTPSRLRYQLQAVGISSGTPRCDILRSPSCNHQSWGEGGTRLSLSPCGDQERGTGGKCSAWVTSNVLLG